MASEGEGWRGTLPGLRSAAVGEGFKYGLGLIRLGY